MYSLLKKLSLSFLLISSSLSGYIIITDIGGDVDDVLALKLAFDLNQPPEAIIVTHHKPLEKALIAKTIALYSGFPNIPIYVGSGCTSENTREAFMQQNSLWPAFFGYLNPTTNERAWNPTQGKAYRDVFGKEFETLTPQIHINSAHQFLISRTKSCKEGETVDIVALAPLHDIYHALQLIKRQEGQAAENAMAKKLQLWTMGGDYPQGYNWLIAPDATDYVLKRVHTICIPSSLIREYKLSVFPTEFESFARAHSKNKLAQAIFKDWIYWNKDDQLKNEKNLCDPITLFLYLQREWIKKAQYISVEFPCLSNMGILRNEFKGTAYCAKGLEGKIIRIKPASTSSIQLVQEINDPQSLRSILMYYISKIFSSFDDAKTNDISQKDALYDQTYLSTTKGVLCEHLNTDQINLILSYLGPSMFSPTTPQPMLPRSLINSQLALMAHEMKS